MSYEPYKYDPDNPLSEDELDELGKVDFEGFLEYLDSQSEYLKQFSKPLSSYHTKRYASLSLKQQGKEITDEELVRADEIGKKNEKKVKEEYKRNRNNSERDYKTKL